MDTWLLGLANQTLTHPVLDVVMMVASTLGLGLYLSSGPLFLMIERHRQTGLAILAASIISLGLVLVFQYTTLRSRPIDVRQLLPPPTFPSYPSGHAALAFGGAVVISLRFQQWWKLAVGGAVLVAYSRMYLGFHYPSDAFAGVILGSAVGAACYGIMTRSKAGWRWLLWPQIALVIIVSQMAYLGLLPLALLAWPMSDKVFHFLLFGAVVFWLNFWFSGRSIQVGHFALPLAIILPLTVALAEEGIQIFSPYRAADVGDVLSDFLGMSFFWWLSRQIDRLTPGVV